MEALVLVFYLLIAVAAPVFAQDAADNAPVYQGTGYPLYPAILKDKPGIPSPLTAVDGAEYVIGLTEVWS